MKHSLRRKRTTTRKMRKMRKMQKRGGRIDSSMSHKQSSSRRARSRSPRSPRSPHSPIRVIYTTEQVPQIPQVQAPELQQIHQDQGPIVFERWNYKVKCNNGEERTSAHAYLRREAITAAREYCSTRGGIDGRAEYNRVEVS